jgi:nucleoid-associated protein YejK
MNLQFVIVHNIDKKGNKVGASLELSDDVLDVSRDDVNNLVTELNDRYRTKNQSYGTFDPTAPSTKFHDELKTFLDSPEKASFIAFTRNTAEVLRTHMDGIAPAKGGYLVFASYLEQRDYISVFFVRDTKGILFKKTGGSYGLNEIDHIDFEKMSMACRLNKQLFVGKTGRYLSFINKKSDVTSLYFTRWIAATDVETNEEDTKNLYDLFKTLTPPVDEDGKQQDKESFLFSVYKHIVSSPQKQVSIPSLSLTYFNDEKFLSDEIEKSGLVINTEFKAHPGKLRNFAQIRVKANSIELNFPHNLFRTVVRINEKNSNQIIIDSADLAEQVRKLAT